MPVKSVGTTPFNNSVAAPAAAAAPPEVAPKPADAAVGHGETRLMDYRFGAGVNAPFIPGVPPPRGETAEGHGGHRGRISIR